MEKLVGKIAVVTGASAGIGKSIVERLVSHGLKVVGCARNKDALDAVAKNINGTNSQGGEMFPFQCDITDEANILKMFDFIKNKFGTLHICINNAGLAHHASLLSGDTKDWKNMLDVNVLGLSICTREAYKLMKSNDSGAFININSMSGHRIMGLPYYSATKFAVTALTEGLRRELRAENSPLKCACISPGLVETEFQYRLNAGDPAKAKAVYSRLDENLQADDVTDAVVFVLQAPPRMDVNDILIRPTAETN